jgi:hypothetical protein
MNKPLLIGGILLLVVIFSAFFLKEKPQQNCMHRHISDVEIRFCGPRVKCTTSKDESGELTVCQYE